MSRRAAFTIAQVVARYRGEITTLARRRDYAAAPKHAGVAFGTVMVKDSYASVSRVLRGRF